MSALYRLVLLCLILPLLAGSLPAGTDPMPLFAKCSGRLSAMMEFQWLMQDARADLTELQRDTMVELLEAVMPKGQEARAMDLRLQAKAALAELLQVAAFDPDQTHAAWAWRRAKGLLAECTSQLVS